MPEELKAPKVEKTVKKMKENVEKVEVKKIEPVPTPTTTQVVEKKSDNTWLKILLGVFAGCFLFLLLGIALFVMATVFVFRKARDVVQDAQEQYEEEQSEQEEIIDENEVTPGVEDDENLIDLESTSTEIDETLDEVDTILEDLDESLKGNDTPPEM